MKASKKLSMTNLDTGKEKGDVCSHLRGNFWEQMALPFEEITVRFLGNPTHTQTIFAPHTEKH